MHPVLIEFAQWKLPAYAAFIGLAGVVALLYLKNLGRQFGGPAGGDFWLLANLAGLGGFIGARLWGVLWHPSVSWSRFERWPALVSSDADLSTYGVLLGVILGVSLYCRLSNRRYLPTLDYVFLAVPLGHGIARLGCFMAGCCYGRPALGGLPWAVTFHPPSVEIPPAFLGIPLHPTQLYEAAGDFAIAGLLRLLVLPRVRAGADPSGTVFFGYLGAYGALRFGNDFFRGEPDLFASTGMTVAQLISLVALLISGAWLLLAHHGGTSPKGSV